MAAMKVMKAMKVMQAMKAVIDNKNLRNTLETLHLEELAYKRRVRELNPQDWPLRLFQNLSLIHI